MLILKESSYSQARAFLLAFCQGMVMIMLAVTQDSLHRMVRHLPPGYDNGEDGASLAISKVRAIPTPQTN